MSSLFRQEACHGADAAQFGDAVFHQPMLLKSLVLLLISVFVAFLLFAAWVRIKTTVPVPGNLSPVSGEVQVYAERSGIMRELMVADGDEVLPGQILAMVEVPPFDSNGNSAGQLQLQRVDQQIRDLLERSETLQQRMQLDLEAERDRIDSREQELALLQDQQEVSHDRLVLMQRSFERQKELHARGLLADAELEKQRDNLLNAVQAHQSQQLHIATQKAELQESVRQLQRLPLQGREDQLQLSSSLSQLKNRRDELQQHSVFAVTAPVAGVVSNQLLVVGDQVDARVPFLSLVDANAALEVNLYVPSRALGKLAVGQDVMVELDAYPSQLHGTLSAELSSIATVAMNPREFLFPLDVQESIYLVRAQLLEIPADMTLRSGMQLQAEIVTGRETLLQKMTAPLSKVRRRF